MALDFWKRGVRSGIITKMKTGLQEVDATPAVLDMEFLCLLAHGNRTVGHGSELGSRRLKGQLYGRPAVWRMLGLCAGVGYILDRSKERDTIDCD